MISKDDFRKVFTILTTAHNRKLSPDEKDAWYSEVKNCDLKTLNLVAQELKRAEWFPTFNTFWTAYNRLKLGAKKDDWREQFEIPEEERVQPEKLKDFLAEFHKALDTTKKE